MSPPEPVEKTERVSLVENYDPQFGFIVDGIIDPSTARKAFMARPSIKFTQDMGAFSPSGLPAIGPIIIDQLLVFPITYANAAALYPNQTITYAAWIYHGFDIATPVFNDYVVAVYDLTHQTQVGSFFIDRSTNAPPLGARLSPSVGFYNLSVRIETIVTPGTGYTSGDVLTVVGGSAQPFTAALRIRVDTVDGSGAILTASFVQTALYTGIPSNPVSVTGGTGTGATFNLTWSQEQGLFVQPYENSPSSFLVLINADTGALDIWNVDYRGLLAATYPLSAVSLLSYQFVLNDQGYIFNSNPGDDSNWQDDAFVQAFLNTATTAVTLAVHNDYLVAFGADQLRYFYVTGATNGSSVAPIINAAFGIGAVSSQCVATSNEYMGWVGPPDATGTTDPAFPVYMVSPTALAPQRISVPIVERSLGMSGVVNAKFITFMGHLSFAITTEVSSTVFVYDLTAQLWYVWQPNPTEVNNNTLTNVSILNNSTYSIGYDANSQHFYLMKVENIPGADLGYGDVSQPYTGFVITKPMDFGISNYKQWGSVTLVCDQMGVAFNATLSYSDNDAQGGTFTAPRQINMAYQQPVTRNLGQSRRRSWQVGIPNGAGQIARIDAIEVVFQVGE